METVTVHPRGTTIAVLPGNDHISKIIRRGNFYESDLLDAIRMRKRTGVYVDVGAYIGNHSVYFSEWCPASKVIAFEPNPVALEVLEENAIRYGIEVHPVAVHDTWDSVEIEPGPANNLGMARVSRVGLNGAGVGSILAVRLDAVVSRIDVLKIDVEGCEAAVLRSGLDLIRRDLPLITTEIIGGDIDAPGGIGEILRPLGYSMCGRYCSTPTYLWEVI